MTPTLSPLERSRIATAVQAGPVKWRVIGRRLSYVANGKECLILTALTDRVFWCLVEQAKEEYRRNVETLRNQKIEAAAKAPGDQARPVEVGEIPSPRCEFPVCDLPESLDAGGAHGEQRNFEQGA